MCKIFNIITLYIINGFTFLDNNSYGVDCINNEPQVSGWKFIIHI